MPILWQNALFQFKTEIARKAWVWFAETRGSGAQYSADKYASEVEQLFLNLRPMVEAAGAGKDMKADDERLDDLMRFILTRHANWRLGGNVRPGFL
jgi:hypothetical protein